MSETQLKVLFVSPWEREGGLATYSQYLVDSLRNRCDITIYPWDHELIFIRGTGIPLISSQLMRQLRRADVVHLQYTFGRYLMSAPLLLLACQFLGIRVVMTQHERFDNLPLSRVLFVYHQLLYFLVDSLVVHTPHRRSMICEYHQNRVKVIPHGVIRRDINRTPTTNLDTILLPGIIRPIKGHDVVIRALTELEGYRLRIVGGVGNKKYLSQIQKLADELDVNERIEWRTRFVPEEELFEELNSAAMVVLPYETHTSMSGILSHCISWGVPTLITDCPSFRSFIDCDAVFLSDRCPSTVAQSIRNLATSESKQKAIIESFDRLSEECSWDAVAYETYVIYQN